MILLCKTAMMLATTHALLFSDYDSHMLGSEQGLPPHNMNTRQQATKFRPKRQTNDIEIFQSFDYIHYRAQKGVTSHSLLLDLEQYQQRTTNIGIDCW